MSKLTREKIGLATTALALLLSLFVFLTMNDSFAWFSHNRAVTSDGITFSVQIPDVQCSMLSLGVLNIEGDTYTFENALHEEGENVGERIQIFELPVDDPNGISYSDYRKALVLELTFTTLKQDRDVSITLNTENTSTDQAFNMAQQNYFSNCMVISKATPTGSETLTKDSTSTQAFFAHNNGVTTKQGSLLLYEGTLILGQPTTLYFIVEYNRNFLDTLNAYILHENPGYITTNYYHDVTFSVS